jgi:hypothetical protein
MVEMPLGREFELWPLVISKESNIFLRAVIQVVFQGANVSS